MTEQPDSHPSFLRWSPYACTITVFVIPLLFLLNTYDSFDLPKLTLAYLTVLVVLGLWGWDYFSGGLVPMKKSPLDSAIAAFLFIAFCSTRQSLDRSQSWAGAYRLYIFGFFPMVAFASLYWMTAQAASKKMITLVSWAMIVSGGMVGLYALLQFSGHELFENMPEVIRGRPWSSLGNSIFTGAVCMMSAAVGIAVLIRPARFTRASFAALVGVFLSLVGMGLSLSRSSWLGLVAAMVVMGSSLFRTSRRRIIGLVISISLLFILGLLSSSPMRRRAQDLFSLEDTSNNARVEGWKGGLNAWRARPWLGSGPDTFFEAFRPFRSRQYVRVTGGHFTQADAHNDFIQVLATLGLAGFICFAWGMWMVFRMLSEIIRSSEKRDALYYEKLGLAAALIALLVQDQFNFSSVSTCVWASVAMGLLAGTRTPENPTGHPPRHSLAAVKWVWAIMILGAMVVAVRPLCGDMVYQSARVEAARLQWFRALELNRSASRWCPWIETYQTETANRCRDLAQLASEGPLRQALWNEAWTLSSDITRRHPANPDSWNNLGVVAMWLTQLNAQNKMEDARAAFEKAVRLDPYFVDAWANLAKWEHLSGHPDQEEVLWRKVLDLEPSHPMARQVLHVHE